MNERNGEVLVEVLPGQGQVVAVELQGFSVVVQVKVSIAQLAVDGTQHLQVLRANLDGSFEEGDARPVVAGLTEPLALQRQLQAGHLHPAAEDKKKRSRVSLKGHNRDQIKLEPERSSGDSSLGAAAWTLAATTLSKQKLLVKNVVYLPLGHENNGPLGGLFVMSDVTSTVHESMFRRFSNRKNWGESTQKDQTTEDTTIQHF